MYLSFYITFSNPNLSFVFGYKFKLLCLWFRASLTYIKNCPTRCNTKQSIILQVQSTCFGCKPHPPSGVRKTVTTASGTSLATLEGGSCTKIWPVPEAVVTVLCTPDDGCGWHPKHVEWTCRIINRVICVASRWTIININLDCNNVSAPSGILAEFKSSA